MKYTAVARRSGNWWAISVPEIKGVHSQVRRLEQVEAMARDAIALMLDVAPDSIEVEVRPEFPEDVADVLSKRRTAKDAEEVAEKTTREVAAKLLAEGWTVRDVGSAFHLSPQRVSQIAGQRRKVAA